MKSPATAEVGNEGVVPAPVTVLLVEDDHNIQRSISFQLGRQGYEVTCCDDGEEGLERATHGRFEVVILDVMLPRMDGLSLCKRLRTLRPDQPIIITSARGTDLDKISGLEFGADDYLAKPFSPAELEARIRAVRRRLVAGHDARQPRRLQVGALMLDADRREIECRGLAVGLTPKEFDLLYLLMRNPGRVFSREALLAQVWGYAYSGYYRAIDAHIMRLRLKLQKNLLLEQEVIEACYGIGYRFHEA